MQLEKSKLDIVKFILISWLFLSPWEVNLTLSPWLTAGLVCWTSMKKWNRMCGNSAAYKGEERKARKWETYLQTYLKARLIMFQCHFKSFYAHFDDCQDIIMNHNYLGREKCTFTFIISPNDESGVQIRHGAMHTSIQCPDKEQKKCVLSGWFLAFGNNKYTTIEGFIYFFYL